MFRRIIKIIFLMLAIAMVVRVLFVDTFSVNGDSMSPTINNGDYVVINRLAYAFSQPKRGDIVVVRPRDTMLKILKRVIGLPGDRIVFDRNKIVVKKDRNDQGEILNEVYLAGDNTTKYNSESFYDVIDPYEYFVLGDNRDVSIDSRKLGPVDKWSVKGKVIYVWHFSKKS